MKQLWIFGDSYADPNYPQSDHAWPKLLQKNFKVTNFAARGTGPDFSLKILKEQIAKTRNIGFKKINVIFLVSDIRRYNFSFFNPKDQVFDFVTSRLGQKVPFLVELETKYEKYRTFYNNFERYYIAHSSYIDTELEKIISYLYMQQKYFDKMLVWPVFQEVSKNLIPKNKRFHIPSKTLLEITYKGNEVLGTDTRPNHLDEEQHSCFYDEIMTYFETTQPINVEKLKKLLDKE